MAFDAPTMMTLTIAIAAAAAIYLWIEWRIVRDDTLLFWSAGFVAITLGSTLATLRSDGLMLLGIWFADGLLVLAHWLFLRGVARFTGARLSRAWWLIVVLWLALIVVPPVAVGFKLILFMNSLLVGVLALRTSALLGSSTETLLPDAGAAPLRYVFAVHGLFYLIKTIPTLVPGTLIDLATYRGTIIQVSLVEGVMAILLIALSMTGTVRYRREREIEHLAERDPLTALFNRRAFEARAERVMTGVGNGSRGALLLIDIDNFKPVNDLYGHAAGDRLLVELSELIRTVIPDNALAARLGGDEFAVILSGIGSECGLRLGHDLRERFHVLAAQAYATPEAVTLSIGLTVFDRSELALETLMHQSDTALYEAKRRGRNEVRAVMATV
ncbi:GGDEF domain-containing protein [Salinisphaera hydrothermalis]|uniref:GGDEF domain-containing protein n=1 Tax=Salinisphaera hydrothermalis TaxID=563188 RepID=UPI00334260C8